MEKRHFAASSFVLAVFLLMAVNVQANESINSVITNANIFLDYLSSRNLSLRVRTVTSDLQYLNNHTCTFKDRSKDTEISEFEKMYVKHICIPRMKHISRVNEEHSKEFDYLAEFAFPYYIKNIGEKYRQYSSMLDKDNAFIMMLYPLTGHIITEYPKGVVESSFDDVFNEIFERGDIYEITKTVAIFKRLQWFNPRAFFRKVTLFKFDANIGEKKVLVKYIKNADALSDQDKKLLRTMLSRRIEKQIGVVVAPQAVEYSAKSVSADEYWDAAINGNIKIIQAWLSQGGDVNSLNPDKLSALHFAARECQVKAIIYLLEHQIDIDARDRGGNTPLIEASAVGCNVDTLAVLIEYGADVNAKSDFTINSIQLLARKSHASGIELLVRHGAEVNVADKFGISPLMESASYAVSKILIANGASISRSTTAGMTALHKAATLVDQRVVALLLKNGADVTAKTTRRLGDNPSGTTPLDWARIANNQAAVKLLVSSHTKNSEFNSKELMQ